MKCNKNSYHRLVIVILAATLVLSILAFFRKDSARNLETTKVGGIENMAAVQELYKSDSYKAQQSAAIDQALAQINPQVNLDNEPSDDLDLEEDIEWDPKDVNEDSDDAEVNNTMISKLEKIKDSTVVHGNKNARFTILEYSEFLCPFCKRQSNWGTINTVLEKYDGEVNAVFRNFIVHGGAAKLGESAECMKELWKEDKYFEFIENMFAYKWTLDVDSISEIADDLWVDSDDMKECLDSDKYAAVVNNQTSEWRNLFGVSWTPGNVIVDKQTGKFVLIPGAYPPEKFIEEIEKMKAE